MGAFSSKPKAPKSSPTVVYYVPTTTGNTSSTPDTSSGVEADPAEVAATRAENVLRRKRGVVGNVLTSLRGVLENGSASVARKTLLGE
ncbi:MAG: hypothetical protein RBR86_06095 [Pseudobdellovibrionaceae bacterium]|jgi:hypothetical protein|nr:hypothetical protein [Pseudobdellovibrionaceae bacterium]